MLRVGLQYVVVIFPDYTHFSYKTAIRGIPSIFDLDLCIECDIVIAKSLLSSTYYEQPLRQL